MNDPVFSFGLSFSHAFWTLFETFAFLFGYLCPAVLLVLTIWSLLCFLRIGRLLDFSVWTLLLASSFLDAISVLLLDALWGFPILGALSVVFGWTLYGLKPFRPLSNLVRSHAVCTGYTSNVHQICMLPIVRFVVLFGSSVLYHSLHSAYLPLNAS